MPHLVNISNECLISKYSFFGFSIMVFINLILLSEDIDKNPEPKTKPNDNLSVWHWNVNSIISHNCQKIAVLKNFAAIHKLDRICISGTFLNNTYRNNDLNLNGYSLHWADHKSHGKRGEVCIYHKETLALEVILILYLNESLLLKVTIRAKKSIIGTVWKFPRQNSDAFQLFLSNFENLLQNISYRNPYPTLLLGKKYKEILCKKYKVVASRYYNNWRNLTWKYHSYLQAPTINRWTYSYS